MKQFFIILLAALMYMPAGAFAKNKKAKFKNKVSLVTREYQDSAGVQKRYGLKKKRKTLLEPRYYMRFEQDVCLFVFYTEQEIYIFDEFGNTINHETADDEEWSGVEVLIEPVRVREDVQCYEINLFFLDHNVMMRNFGTFFYKDGHLYQIMTEPVIIPLN